MEKRENPSNELPVKIIEFVQKNPNCKLGNLIIQFSKETYFNIHIDKLFESGTLKLNGSFITLHLKP